MVKGHQYTSSRLGEQHTGALCATPQNYLYQLKEKFVVEGKMGCTYWWLKRSTGCICCAWRMTRSGIKEGSLQNVRAKVLVARVGRRRTMVYQDMPPLPEAAIGDLEGACLQSSQ
jgi:hypothetical protein